jgi:hypothetical protein
MRKMVRPTSDEYEEYSQNFERHCDLFAGLWCQLIVNLT